MAYEERFSRTVSLLGAEAADRLKNASVALFGLGGVGGYTAEALARSGVGALLLTDADKICESNINRQILADYSTVGRPKASTAAARIRAINPDCDVKLRECFFSADNSFEFDFREYDYVVDAVDTASSKLELVLKCLKEDVPLISCMGTGNRLDASRLKIGDIYDTACCPLARVMRKLCRESGVPRLKVLFSTEMPVNAAALPDCRADDGAVILRRGVASYAVVPAVAGLLIAQEVILSIAGIRAGRDSV